MISRTIAADVADDRDADSAGGQAGGEPRRLGSVAPPSQKTRRPRGNVSGDWGGAGAGCGSTGSTEVSSDP